MHYHIQHLVDVTMHISHRVTTWPCWSEFPTCRPCCSIKLLEPCFPSVAIDPCCLAVVLEPCQYRLNLNVRCIISIISNNWWMKQCISHGVPAHLSLPHAAPVVLLWHSTPVALLLQTKRLKISPRPKIGFTSTQLCKFLHNIPILPPSVYAVSGRWNDMYWNFSRASFKELIA